nr:hypothetical protein [Tanacetum cinerariifolium]
SHYDKLTNDLRKSQFDVLSYKTRLESVEAKLLVYQQNETIFEEDIKLLKLNVELRENTLVALRKKFKKAEQERDNSESDVSLPASPVYDRYQLGEGYHVFPPPYTRTFIPPKPDLSNRPSAPIIEDWVSDSEDESEAEPTQNAPSFVPPPKHVKSLRLSVNPIKHPILAEHLRQEIPKSRGHQNSKNRKTCFVCKSLTHLIKDYDYYKKQMVQPPAKNLAQRRNHQHYTRMTHPNP